MPLVTDGSIDVDLPITDLPILFWHNVVSSSLLTTDSEDPNFPVTNLANGTTSLKWKQDRTDSPASVPDYITINVTGQGPINYIAIAFHNLGSIGAIVAVEGTGSGASPSHQDSPNEAEYVTGYSPTDDSPIIFMFEEVETDMLRLRIENSAATTAEIAILFVGKATVMEEGIQADHTPLSLGIVHENTRGMSESGQFLGRIVTSQWHESTASFANMTQAWAREHLVPFLEYAAEYPFFWAWQPSSYPNDVVFAWLDNDPAPVIDIDGYISISLAMRGNAE